MVNLFLITFIRLKDDFNIIFYGNINFTDLNNNSKKPGGFYGHKNVSI